MVGDESEVGSGVGTGTWGHVGETMRWTAGCAVVSSWVGAGVGIGDNGTTGGRWGQPAPPPGSGSAVGLFGRLRSILSLTGPKLFACPTNRSRHRGPLSHSRREYLWSRPPRRRSGFINRRSCEGVHWSEEGRRSERLPSGKKESSRKCKRNKGG